MAHAKCLTCRARVWREGTPADHFGDLCPGCGGPLEPVSELSELIGFRSLRARPRSLRGERADRSQSIAAEIRETIARHDQSGSGGPTPIAGTTATRREPRDGRPSVS